MEWYSLVKARIIGANVQHTNDRSPYWIWPCVISFAFMQTWRKPEKRELFGLSQWISLQLGIVPFFLLKIQKDSFLECGSLRPCIGPDAALKDNANFAGTASSFWQMLTARTMPVCPMKSYPRTTKEEFLTSQVTKSKRGSTQLAKMAIPTDVCRNT